MRNFPESLQDPRDKQGLHAVSGTSASHSECRHVEDKATERGVNFIDLSLPRWSSAGRGLLTTVVGHQCDRKIRDRRLTCSARYGVSGLI
ncbi:hypothetical protein EVAR_7791_1 [Eumeta japonica]|uniref:Uncharacterized protein n=1 Tax=Eumeta variegata TaxID=151549 RepID=A0A4C1TMA7_EUMVA|nr:hypothetical protein EVAR_7791_1 [Eumeta japonica]